MPVVVRLVVQSARAAMCMYVCRYAHRMEGLNLGVPSVAGEIDQSRENLRKAGRPALVLFRTSHHASSSAEAYCQAMPVLWGWGQSLGRCRCRGAHYREQGLVAPAERMVERGAG